MQSDPALCTGLSKPRMAAQIGETRPKGVNSSVFPVVFLWSLSHTYTTLRLDRGESNDKTPG